MPVFFIMTRKFNSLQATLLVHEISFIILLIITATVGVSWSIFWQKNSEESVRLSSMNTAMQNIRGQTYRQLKEVFDASFLHDADAEDEYQKYTHAVNEELKALESLADEDGERLAVGNINYQYANFYKETVTLFDLEGLSSQQRNNLDDKLEEEVFFEFERAFEALHQILKQKESMLTKAKETWSGRLKFIVFIPILFAMLLLVIARRFLKENVVEPLSNVVEGAKLISKGELQHSIEPIGAVELARLAEVINSMADELVVSRDKLVENKKQAALGELIPLVAHNIRNPLAGIRAASQVACDEDISESTRDTLSDIIIAVDRLERWVTSLLTYLHPVNLNLTPARLTKVADDALSLIELQLVDKKLTLDRFGWDNTASQINIDVSLFEQVIFNLVQNAIEASSEGDTITLSYREEKALALFSINDQGRGISFDPVSEQIVGSESQRLNCGLGIPFADKVVKQHQGTLSYATLERGGTSAVISLALLK